jgi:Concanavalin A-like lectin/glucanases superfamily
MLVLACSVYEAPSQSSDAGGGQSGNAGGDVGNAPSVAGSAGADAGGKSQTSAGATSVGGTNQGGTTGGSAGPAGGSATSGSAGDLTSQGGEGGAPSASDNCPADPTKLEPGECGCGVPEAPSAANDDCHSLESLLIHRYDFEGSGTAVKDRVGSAHGVIARGATLSKLDGKGVALLGGGDVGPYVDLPNGLASSLTNATFEAWVTWGGGTDWQRIFDFGDSTASMPENNQANGKSYLFVTPRSGAKVVQIGYSINSVGAEQDVGGPSALPQSLTQVVAVVDDANDKLLLYLDGAKAGERAWTDSLSKLNDVNVWLGRSQYANDAELNAVYHEFRIYGAALSAPQVAAMFHAGTDPKFLAY